MIAVHALIPFDESSIPTGCTYVATGHCLGRLRAARRRRAVADHRTGSGTVAASNVDRGQHHGACGRPSACHRARCLDYTDAGITGVILPYYAMLFLLAIPLLLLRTRWSS